VLLQRVVLRNFKSISRCNVELGALTYLVGPNGAGKSNFLEALHLVSDALLGSLDQALSARGGLAEVRRKSNGHPTHFGIRLDLTLPGGESARYAFSVAALQSGAHEVQEERCSIGLPGCGPSFLVRSGSVVNHSETVFPAVSSDRLALVVASGLPAFRPVFDALVSMGLYNLNPRLMREPQKPQDARILKPAGDNLASVVGALERSSPQRLRRIEQYLQSVVPTIHGVRRSPVGPFETIEFRQEVAGARNPWYFPAMNMSDGTLRALGVLVALFQGTPTSGPGLVGIEEPETALHPAAAAALREALQAASQHTQVVVTSHSPELLDTDEVMSEQIRAVAETDGATWIAPIDEAARSMLRQGLYSAGELLRIGHLAPDAKVAAARGRGAQAELFPAGST
jgi:predicted ATPase